MINATWTSYEIDILKFKYIQCSVCGGACAQVKLHFCWGAHPSLFFFFFRDCACFFLKLCDWLKSVDFTTLKWEEQHRETAVLIWSRGFMGICAAHLLWHNHVLSKFPWIKQCVHERHVGPSWVKQETHFTYMLCLSLALKLSYMDRVIRSEKCLKPAFFLITSRGWLHQFKKKNACKLMRKLPYISLNFLPHFLTIISTWENIRLSKYHHYD